MRLTLWLLKRRNIVPGHQWVGKHRLPYVAHQWNIDRLSKRLQIEEQNLFYLRHPYLTPAQEKGSVAHLNKNENYIKTMRLIKASARKVQLSNKMESHIGHLNCSTNWETYK